MAQQLIQDRTPAAYAGVEAYARAHSKEDAGALAWLVVGYAHFIDKDYAQAIEPLNRARPMAGDLGDYIAYYLGTCYLQTGHQAEGMAALANFETTYPDSLLIRDARLSYANALLSEGRAAEAAELLEKNRLPARSDIELAIGKAYAALGKSPKASEALGNVYYNMPTSAEADTAYTELKKLSIAIQPTPVQRKTRADLLMKARRYNDAADEYRELASHATPADRPAAELAMADALHRSGRNREAKAELSTLAGATPEQNAQRLYILGEVAWASDQNELFYQLVDELRQMAPTSSWLESALLSVANLRLVHHEYDQALDAFRELQQRFPKGSKASYAHWKAAWLTLRMGRNDEAKKLFEEQIAAYPGGNEANAAIYWRARLAEEDNDPTMARAFYQKLSDRYRNYYYAELARQRLKKLPAGTDPPGEYPLLDRIPPLEHGEKITLAEAPPDDLHYQKAKLLGNGGLIDLAVRELDKAASDDQDKSWAPAETAQLYTDTGHYDRAIEVICGHPDAASRVLGRALSATVLVGFEEILRRQRARSVPGGVADSAGIGVQSRCRFARERRWADATASSDRQTSCASGGNEALQPEPALYRARESGTRHTLLPRHGRQVRRIVRAGAGRLQRRGQSRRGVDGAGQVSRRGGVRRVDSIHRDARIRAGHHAERERVPAALRDALTSGHELLCRGFTRIHADLLLDLFRSKTGVGGLLEDKVKGLRKAGAPFLVHPSQAADCAMVAALETVQNKANKCHVISGIHLTVKPI